MDDGIDIVIVDYSECSNCGDQWPTNELDVAGYCPLCQEINYEDSDGGFED